ncbi:MAG: N-acetylmuramoyl-L-alanine amidase family protein [Hungatella sp.]
MMKYLICTAICAIGTIGMTMTGLGAVEDDYDEIKGGTITVTSSIKANTDLGELDVTTESSRFSVENFTFVGAGSSWKPGEIPKVKVNLRANDGRIFSTRITMSKITVKGGTCSGLKRLESGALLELSIRLSPVPAEFGEIGDAFWVTNPIGKAQWDAADNAGAYQLKLYRGNTHVKTVDKTTTKTYDFYPYMTKVGDYYFKVRPVPRSTNEAIYIPSGNWVTSNELYIDRATVSKGGESASDGIPESGASTPTEPEANHTDFGWVQNGSGWWYHANDGTYPINQWSYIDNKWYLFDKAGYMMTGWQKWSNRYYYLTVNGDMVTGWLEDRKKWYYLQPDGAMMTGWIQPDGKWYYLGSDGVRVNGWAKVNGRWYYFNPANGVMMTNTVIGGRTVNGDGVWTE